MWEEGGRDDFRDEGEERGEQVGDREVQDEVVHATHLMQESMNCCFRRQKQKRP